MTDRYRLLWVYEDGYRRPTTAELIDSLADQGRPDTGTGLGALQGERAGGGDRMSATPDLCDHGLDQPHMWKRSIVDENGLPDFMWGTCLGPWENQPYLWWHESTDGSITTWTVNRD